MVVRTAIGYPLPGYLQTDTQGEHMGETTIQTSILDIEVGDNVRHTVDDLKGLKIRAPGGRQQEILKRLGAAPQTMPLTEVYMA